MYRKIIALLLAISVSLMLVGCSVSGTAEAPQLETDANGQVALALAADIMGGHYSYACENYLYTKQMADAMSASLLYLSMMSAVKKCGSFEAVESIAKLDGAYYVGLKFKKESMTAIVSFDGYEVAGFVITDWVDPNSLLPPSEMTLPDDAVERDVVFGDPQLPGKLVVPDGATTVVILLSGSGPNDADSTLGPNKPLRDIAYDLARHGIASLRFDKRTAVYPSQSAANLDFTPVDEYITDAVSAYFYLAGHRDEYTDVFIAGHSMGGYMLPAIAPFTPDAAGYIFLSANSTPLHELAKMQIEYLRTLDGVTRSQQQAYLDMLTELDKIGNLADDVPAGTLIFGAYPAYWQWLSQYDPLSEVALVEAPMLFIAGGRDYQVPESELSGWKGTFQESGPLRMFSSLPTVNHIFMEGEGYSVPSEYSVPGFVDNAVADEIAAFIRATYIYYGG